MPSPKLSRCFRCWCPSRAACWTNRSFVCHSPVEYIKKEIHDILCFYYKVARKRFVNNVYYQAVDHCLLTEPMSPLNVFNQSVSILSSSMLISSSPTNHSRMSSGAIASIVLGVSFSIVLAAALFYSIWRFKGQRGATDSCEKARTLLTKSNDRG